MFKSFFLISLLTATANNGSIIYAERFNSILKNVSFHISAINNYNQEKYGKIVFKSDVIEYYRTIYNEDTKTYNLYIDFEGSTGYIIFAKENEVVKYENNIDLIEARNSTNDIVYYDGFICKRNNNEYKPIELNETEQTTINSNNESKENTRGTASIVEYGNLEYYLYNKYEYIDFSLLSSNRLSGLNSSAMSEGYTQMAESVFVANNGTMSEGNCGLVSMANILAYYNHYGNKNYLASYNTFNNVYHNNIPSSLISAANAAGYYLKANNPIPLHELYYRIRYYAVNNYNYVCGGMTDTKTSGSFLSALSYYGYSSSSYTVCNPCTKTDITTEISNNRPIQFRTHGDMVYDNHGTMITGHETYVGIRQVSPFHYQNVSIFCVSIYDGQSQYERWYDVESLSTYPYSSTGMGYRATYTDIAKTYVS